MTYSLAFNPGDRIRFLSDLNTGASVPGVVLENDGDGNILVRLEDGREGLASPGDLSPDWR